jgi:hypothetical protein
MSKIYIKINFLEFTALCADLKPSKVFESAASRHFQKLCWEVFLSQLCRSVKLSKSNKASLCQGVNVAIAAQTWIKHDKKWNGIAET